jgi:hypothetical protein
MPFEAQRTGEMRTIRWLWLAVALGTAASTAHAQEPDRHATGLQADVWTDRGNDAVYQPGDTMIVQTHVSHDANLLVYEIDTEGAVSVLFPERGGSGFVEGGSTIDIPSEHSNLQLVVEPETGESFIVAIASRDPFRDLPWYLRPYDPQAEGNGYAGEPDDEEGITKDGRIVGDPFVAMERIRRRVLQHPDDPQSFGTSYTSYYTHERVLYPRYLCADCHRPDYYSWWDGFDPYYAQCPVVEFRVNWGWYWGPSYWFGSVPYYYYAIRPDCPPEWRMYSAHRWYSSWDCWGQWHERMGSGGQAPPADYIPSARRNDPMQRPRTTGPGLLASRAPARGRHGPWRPISDAVRPVDRPDDRRVALGSSRDLWRGRLEPRGPGRQRGNDSETRSWSRGIPEGRRGGFRWVGPGYGAAPRPVEVRTPTGRDRRAESFPQRREWGGEGTAPPRGVAPGEFLPPRREFRGDETRIHFQNERRESRPQEAPPREPARAPSYGKANNNGNSNDGGNSNSNSSGNGRPAASYPRGGGGRGH